MQKKSFMNSRPQHKTTSITLQLFHLRHILQLRLGGERQEEADHSGCDGKNPLPLLEIKSQPQSPKPVSSGSEIKMGLYKELCIFCDIYKTSVYLLVQNNWTSVDLHVT
jgi:hypothetical protein